MFACVMLLQFVLFSSCLNPEISGISVLMVVGHPCLFQLVWSHMCNWLSQLRQSTKAQSTSTWPVLLHGNPTINRLQRPRPKPKRSPKGSRDSLAGNTQRCVVGVWAGGNVSLIISNVIAMQVKEEPLYLLQPWRCSRDGVQKGWSQSYSRPQTRLVTRHQTNVGVQKPF